MSRWGHRGNGYDDNYGRHQPRRVCVAGHMAEVHEGCDAIDLASVFLYDDKAHEFFSDRTCSTLCNAIGVNHSASSHLGAVSSEMHFVPHEQFAHVAAERDEQPVPLVSGGYVVDLSSGRRYPLHLIEDHMAPLRSKPLAGSAATGGASQSGTSARGAYTGGTFPLSQVSAITASQRDLDGAENADEEGPEVKIANRTVMAEVPCFASLRDQVVWRWLGECRAPELEGEEAAVASFDYVPRRDQLGYFCRRPLPIVVERASHIEYRLDLGMQYSGKSRAEAQLTALRSVGPSSRQFALLPPVAGSSVGAKRSGKGKSRAGPATSGSEDEDEDECTLVELFQKRRRGEPEAMERVALLSVLDPLRREKTFTTDAVLERHHIENATTQLTLTAAHRQRGVQGMGSQAALHIGPPLNGVLWGIHRAKPMRKRALRLRTRLPMSARLNEGLVAPDAPLPLRQPRLPLQRMTRIDKFALFLRHFPTLTTLDLSQAGTAAAELLHEYEGKPFSIANASRLYRALDPGYRALLLRGFAVLERDSLDGKRNVEQIEVATSLAVIASDDGALISSSSSGAEPSCSDESMDPNGEEFASWIAGYQV